jgi:hypothetical protein
MSSVLTTPQSSIESVTLLKPIIGDDLEQTLSEFHNILLGNEKEKQNVDLKLIRNDSNPQPRSNDQDHDTTFIPGPMINYAVKNVTSLGFKSDTSNIKTQSSKVFIELEQNNSSGIFLLWIPIL